jgi:hypothetical protein
VICLPVFQISTIKEWAQIIQDFMETLKTVFRVKHKEALCHLVWRVTWTQTRYQHIKQAPETLSSIKDATFNTLTWRHSRRLYIFTVAALPMANSHIKTFALMLHTIKKIMDLDAHKLCISLKWCLVHSSFKVQIWIKIRANHFKLTQCKWYLTLPRNLSKTLLPKVASWTRAQTWINRHCMISWRTFIMTMLLMSTKSSKRTKSIINLVHIKEALKPTHVAALKN